MIKWWLLKNAVFPRHSGIEWHGVTQYEIAPGQFESFSRCHGKPLKLHGFKGFLVERKPPAMPGVLKSFSDKKNVTPVPKGEKAKRTNDK